MKAGQHITYLQHSEIDKAKWDHCVSNAGNELIYAYAYYLDRIAKHWDALVLNDYEAVMPLTWNKKYGIYYLYQPAFTASLGIFGKKVDEKLTLDFIEAIPKKFKLAEIALNHGNSLIHSQSISTTRNNYILPLNKDYTTMFSSYRENTRRNIKKAQQLNCIVKKNIALAEIINLSKPAMQRMTNVKEEDYTNFETLYHFLYKKKQAVTYGVYTAGNELVSSCVYFFSNKRAYYILVGNHPNGKTSGASHYLIDRFIHDHADQDLILDFEGSDIRNLAFFYSSFGATLETYPFLRINRLPFWLKWMKR
jgi:hypothetical protein